MNTQSVISSLTIRCVPELLKILNEGRKIRRIGQHFGLISGFPFLHPSVYGGKFWENDFKNILENMPEHNDRLKIQKDYMRGNIKYLKTSQTSSIINISSGAGIMGFPLRSPYAASKWAVVGMTKTLAMELGKYKIRVNAICPGTIKGDRMKKVIRDKAKFTKISAKKIESDFVSMASMKSWINEEDIGNMCAHLISDEANKVSGQVIAVDGNTERMD